MPGGRRNIFEDLLDKDEFGFETNNPNSEVTSEKKVITNADGSSIETIVKNPNGAPSVVAEKERKQGFAATADAKTATNEVTKTAATTGGKVGFAEASRNYSNADMAKYENDQKLFDSGLLTEAPVDPSKVSTVAGVERELAFGATSPRGEEFAKLKAENKLSEFDDVLTMGVESGSISPEDAAKAKAEAQSEFDKASGLDTKPVVDDKIATGGTPFDTPAPFEGLSATEIMGAETDAKKLIADSKKATTVVNNITAELDEGKDPETIFGEIKSFFKDNPVMGQAILSAVASYISTGSLWKGAAAGIQGFAGGMQTEAATEVATAAATAKAKLERTTTIASYVKDGYTQASAQAFLDSNGGTELKFSKRKLNDEFAKILYRAQVKGETGAQKATAKEQEQFMTITGEMATRLGKHWTDKEREQYGIPDATNAVQTSALQFKEEYGLSYADFASPEIQVNFGEGLDDWNEANRQAVNDGRRPIQSPSSFIAARINRRYAHESGLPLDIFTGANGEVNGEQLAKVRSIAKAKAYSGDTPEDATEANVFAFWQEAFAKENDDELQKQAGLAGMAPFLFWIELNA